MKRILISLVTIMIFLLGACSNDNGETNRENETEEGQVTLEFAAQHSAHIIKAFEEEWIPAFEEEHPNIKINITSDPDKIAFSQRIKNQYASGIGPDVMRMTIEDFRNFASSETLLDIEEFVERDQEELNMDDFADRLLDAFTYDDKLYMLPTDWNGSTIHYNKDVFDEAGVDYPSEDWTWDDFLEIAKELTVDKNGDGKIDQYGFGVTDRLFNTAPWINAAGGRFLSEDFTEALINSPEAEEALQFYVDLVQEHQVALHIAGAEPAQLTDAFISGKVAMIEIPRASTASLEGKMEFDVSHNPKGPVKIGGIFGVGGYAILEDTEHPEEAWQFTKWLNSEEMQEKIMAVSKAVPGRESVAHLDSIMGYPEHAERYYNDSEYAEVLETPEAFAQMESEFNSELGLMFEGKKSVKEALEYLEERFNENVVDKN